MAAYENTVRPRKTITTYGKPSRTHLAGHTYTKLVHSAEPPELTKADLTKNNEPTSSNHERARKAYKPLPRKRSVSKTQTAVDLYDVPLSDDEEPPLMRKNVTMSAQKVKVKSAMYGVKPSDDEDQPTMRKDVTRLLHNAPRNPTIYDVPISDDEITPSAKKNLPKGPLKVTQKPVDIQKAKNLSVTEPVNTQLVETPEWKKRKLSPAEQPRRESAKLPVAPPPKALPYSRSGKVRRASNLLPKRQVIRTTPVSESIMKKPAASRGSQKQQNKAPEPQVPRSPTSTGSGMSQSSTTQPGRHLSPKAAKLWVALLDNNHETEGTATTSGDELSLVVSNPKKFYPMARKLPKTAALTKPTSTTPRKRLIDSLVDQTPGQDSDNVEEDSESEHDNALLEDHFHHLNESRTQSRTPEVPTFTASQPNQGSQITGPKFTYSRQRSMLVEEDMMEQLAFDMPLQAPQVSHRRRGSLPSLKPLSSFREEEEEEDEAANTTTIRTIHELRQAGANSRFADEVEDLLDRIGKPAAKPSSIRRSGLLDLGIKMKDKAFVRQFRAHGAEQRLFTDIGQEIDTVSGFLMTSLITPILAEGSVPLVVSQLQQNGITKLLNRLMSVEKGIVFVAKERKTNMSKMAQNSLSAYHDCLLEIPAWKDLSPRELSPRTLALKCLELMVRQTREAGDANDIISEELNISLFEILRSADGDASWDLPHETEAIDFHLTLSTLESHSLMARTAQDETIWIRQFLPIIGNTLNAALNRPLDSFGEQQILALKLTVNVTNHNPKACDAIASSDLMFTILGIIVAKFKNMSNLWAEEEIVATVDNLILLIGAMINFALWSTKALRNIDNFAGTAKDPLDELIRIFVDNREKTFEVDSQHESHKNVPFGYLSVLLGHFCLLPAIEKRVRMGQTTKTLRPLITSINEFIVYHKAADDEIAPDEDGHSPHVTVTKQLEDLVKKLITIKGSNS